MLVATDYSRFIEPYSIFRANKTSFDITASNKVFVETLPSDFSCEESFMVDVKNQTPLHLEQKFMVVPQDIEEGGQYILIPPNDNVIVETSEVISLDNDHCAFYQAVGNLNLANIAAVGSAWMQPGWRGKLKINFRNFNRVHSYKLYAGQVIGQVVFVLLKG